MNWSIMRAETHRCFHQGKHAFGMVKVGEKGQIVIPAKARKIFDIKPGDVLMVLGDEEQGIALLKDRSYGDGRHAYGDGKLRNRCRGIANM